MALQSRHYPVEYPLDRDLSDREQDALAKEPDS